MKKVSVVIVLYKPNKEVFENFKKTLSIIQNHHISDIYCIDNSPKDFTYSDIFSTLTDVEYIKNFNHGGLAHALNIGCSFSKEKQNDFVILMDQDTIFTDTYFSTLIPELESVDQNVGIIAPNMKRLIRDENGNIEILNKPFYKEITEEVQMVVTSGSVIRTNIFDKIGFFDEKLFIGHIDRDYCSRVISSGNKIIRIGTLFVLQENGNATTSKALKLGNRVIYSSNYSPDRYYYAVRNEIYLRKQHGKNYIHQRSPIFKNLILVLLLEEDKVEKIKQMYMGYRDYKELLD